jgi:hypothetical protein
MDRHGVIRTQARFLIKPNSLTGLIGEDPTSWPAAITWRLDPIVIPKLLYRAWRASPFQICGRGT